MNKNNRIRNSCYLGADGILDVLMPKRSPHILLACMPKSASTFIASALSELPGFKRYRLTPDWGAREQELSSARLSRYNRRKYIAQHHVRHSEWTQRLIEQYQLTPVVLVRDFADCTISIRDHNLQRPGPSPMAYFDESLSDMAIEDFEEAIVRLALPWYFNFYAGWRAAGNAPIYDFDDYTTDPVRILKEILAGADVEFSDETIETAVNQVGNKYTRFNVGESGRGRNLSSGAKKALRRMMDFYPNLLDDPLFVKTASTLSRDSEE